MDPQLVKPGEMNPQLVKAREMDQSSWYSAPIFCVLKLAVTSAPGNLTISMASEISTHVCTDTQTGRRKRKRRRRRKIRKRRRIFKTNM